MAVIQIELTRWKCGKRRQYNVSFVRQPTKHTPSTCWIFRSNLPIVIIVAVVLINPVIFWASYFWRAKYAALGNSQSAQYTSPGKGHQLSDPWWILIKVRKAFCIAMKMRWPTQCQQYPTIYVYLSFKLASLYFRSRLILVHHWNRLDESVLMAGPKPLVTEFSTVF